MLMRFLTMAVRLSRLEESSMLKSVTPAKYFPPRLLLLVLLPHHGRHGLHQVGQDQSTVNFRESCCSSQPAGRQSGADSQHVTSTAGCFLGGSYFTSNKTQSLILLKRVPVWNDHDRAPHSTNSLAHLLSSQCFHLS